MMAEGLTIGVTFFLRKGEGTVWTNGGVQHCAFLCRLLERCRRVGRVVAINGGDGDDPPPMLARYGLEFVRLPEVIDRLDVLVEAGAQVSAEDVAHVQARGGRAVGFKYGNAFVIDAERVIHGKPSGSIFNGSRFDEVWTNPQHERTCRSYWETTYRCPVRVLPHVWEPTFVDMTRLEFPPNLAFGYRPRPGPKRVVIFEPNTNIVKTCTIPLLAVERAFRERPELVGDVYVTNSVQLKDHLTFLRFAQNLDVVQSGRCSFEARFNTPWFASMYADVAVLHQWENDANYLVYDLLHGGYPIVHNYPSLPAAVGYRYDGFDAGEAGRALVRAIEVHDQHLDAHRDACASFLATLRVGHPTNVAAHEAALDRLFTDRLGRLTAA